jgi:Ca-activated chloride channel homolog
MRSRHLMRAAVIAFLFTVPSTFGQTQQPQQLASGEPIRVSVDRVNLGVVVTDRSGHFVEGLHRDDFQVFDNGVAQPLTNFLSIEEPANVVLLIESGPALALFEKNHARAADKLLTSIAADDRVAIATYSNNPELMLDFTADKTPARAALGDLNFFNGFAQLNLSSSLATMIDWLAAKPGKKSIVLLSTGVDTSPETTWQAVERKLQISDVCVLAVSLSGDLRKPAKIKKPSPEQVASRAYVKQVLGEADDELRIISLATGGRAYFPKNAKEFQAAYAEIAQLIRHEYSLAFALPLRDGRVHSLEVKVKQAGYGVGHRQAYLAPN